MANWYVSSLAPGEGNGQSEEDPWTLAEAVININVGTIVAGDTVWLKNDGTYLSGAISITSAGLYNNSKRISGYNTVIEDGGKATIQANATITTLLGFTIHYWMVENLILDGNNTTTYNYSSGGNMVVLRRMESKNAVNGFLRGLCFNCLAYNNSGIGFYYNYFAINCLSRNNSGGGFHGSDLRSGCINCIGKANGGYNFIISEGMLINCISDGGTGDGIQFYRSVGANLIIVNAPSGKYGLLTYTGDNILSGSYIHNINFYNNVNNYNNNPNDMMRNIYYLDPQFKDPANLNYTRTGNNLGDKGFSEVGMVSGIDYGIDIGIDQRKIVNIPIVGDVRKDIEFGYVDDLKLGILDLPVVGDVRKPIKFDNLTKEGTCVVPDKSDVREGISVDVSDVGILDLPSINDVEKGVKFDRETKIGTFKEPGIGNVRKDTQYGANNVEFTGICSVPTASQVLKDIPVDATIGNVIEASEEDVRKNIQYGANGITKTGKLDLPIEDNVRKPIKFDQETKTGKCTVPAKTNVRKDVDVDVSDKGLLDLPIVGNVRKPIKFDNLTKEGKLDLPATRDVEEGIKFDQSTKTGEFVVPLGAEVQKNVEYGYQGEFEGTLETTEVKELAEIEIETGDIELTVEVE